MSSATYPGTGGASAATTGSKSRKWSRIRNTCSDTLCAYSLVAPDTPQLMRRLSMWVILIVRLIISILNIIFHAYGSKIVSIIVGLTLGVLGFVIIGWCLAVIGEAKGTHRTCGITWGRVHFDIALGLFVVIHLGMLIGGLVGLAIIGVTAGWIILWLQIAVITYIAAKASEGGRGIIA
ncbi:hypothetical protein B0H63DRAFT_560055 [Podospora didyma]|uniref:Uncharacterized protein n=1 Tax=Podospora didyma TaxID=330526 RepID=A0AAE0TZS1_9PEZI|nr:hypothetical protein B0H63DRAFT_560055 [Podospora didyma]